MKINKSLRNKIALGLLVGGLSVPMMATESFAAPMARPSVRVSTPTLISFTSFCFIMLIL